MKTRPHHPRLARLLAPLVGSQKQAQYMLSLYLVRGSMTVEEWVDYRAHLAGILHHLLPLRHYPAVERLRMPPAASSTTTPTLGTYRGRSSVLRCLRGSEKRGRA